MAVHVTPKQPTSWKRRVLVPFWILRIIVLLFVIGVYCWAISRLEPELRPAWGGIIIFLLFVIIVLLLEIYTIVKFLRDALHPSFFLTTTTFQTMFWTGVLVMAGVSFARDSRDAAVGLGFLAFVWASFAGLSVYAILKYIKWKKETRRGNYVLAANTAPLAPGYHPPPYANAAPYQHQMNAYASTQYAPNHMPAHQGEAAEYYSTQPMAKPAQVV
ncbi:hypothetical protein M011DRAFT_475473 [Sporormia fimetaria CBS 119925]|uniref:MARVEL domain-containing protein n=1 Tax=Sporormia fimetaria CBS 119925 TaxID=1340428 RepID=A0A6A6VFN7_9PLEO|nr:hypothetical protein M011DRAFT_475473 [Sporormia fimetaria CBS 119925]